MGFTLTNPVFLAGKSAAACALALVFCEALQIPDRVTASFVAVLCCSPGALMGLRISVDQMAGSLLGGFFGTLGAQLELPIAIGVPAAVGVAILTTHRIGFHRGTVAAAFTALFLQLVSFGEPLETFGYRLGAVGIAGLSAFVVNVTTSSLFYERLFQKRIRRLTSHIADLLQHASENGPSALVVVFPLLTELKGQLRQALREVRWRRNQNSEAWLASVLGRVEWLEDFVHLVVNLQYSIDADNPELKAFLAWLVEREGPAPTLPPAAQQTRERIIALVESERFASSTPKDV